MNFVPLDESVAQEPLNYDEKLMGTERHLWKTYILNIDLTWKTAPVAGGYNTFRL